MTDPQTAAPMSMELADLAERCRRAMEADEPLPEKPLWRELMKALIRKLLAAALASALFAPAAFAHPLTCADMAHRVGEIFYDLQHGLIGPDQLNAIFDGLQSRGELTAAEARKLHFYVGVASGSPDVGPAAQAAGSSPFEMAQEELKMCQAFGTP